MISVQNDICVNDIKIKRAYDKPDPDDGIRVLVDRLWPLGCKKEKLKIDAWFKDVAPSEGLRKWFDHREDRWEEFRSRYLNELKQKKGLQEQLCALACKNVMTLIYAAKDEERNNAVVVLGWLNSFL